MNIYFCDLCNESVPQADLDSGHALFRKGRIVCSQCDAAMSGAHEHQDDDETQLEDTSGPEVRPKIGSETTIVESGGVVPGRPVGVHSSAGVAVGVALASVALVLAVGGSAFLYDQMEGRHQALVAELEEARREAVGRGERLQARLDLALADVSRESNASRNEVRDLTSRIDGLASQQRDSVATLREDLYRVVEKTGELDALVALVDRHEAELERVAATAASLRTEVGEFGNRLEDVRTTDATPAPVGGAEPADAEWLPLLGDLQSQNSGTRWQAVQSLGATGDPAVAPYLTAMLQDQDIFVRMATARILGDLEAVVAIPHLIDALEDVEASVREASVVSLRAITGRDFRFDPGARDAERAKRVKAWRDWWKKAEADLLPGNA